MQWLFQVSDFTQKQWRGTWLCFSLILLSFGNKGWSFLFYWNVVPLWLPTVKKPRGCLTSCQRGERWGIVLSQEGMDLSQACPSASYFHTLEHLPSTEHDEERCREWSNERHSSAQKSSTHLTFQSTVAQVAMTHTIAWWTPLSQTLNCGTYNWVGTFKKKKKRKKTEKKR